jgi:hypothetical protein
MGDSMSTIINATTTNGVVIQPDNSGSLQLATNSGTTALTIDTSQNVGIGTASPSTKLTIGTLSGNATNSGDLLINQTGNTIASNGGIELKADGVSNGYATRISTIFNGISAYDMAFLRRNDSATWTESMRITSGGEVYIAGTTDRGAFNLQCNGTGVWGAGAYTNGSDERIKDNITPLDTGLDVVAKLNPVTYTYKEDWSRDQSIQTGFIAQDLLVALEGKNYVDGIVNQSSEYMSVAYQNIIPILTKAIQEQQTIINDLKARVEALEGAKLG